MAKDALWGFVLLRVLRFQVMTKTLFTDQCHRSSLFYQEIQICHQD